MRKPERVDARVKAEHREAIVKIAERYYDGNVSMALRRVIERGLREWEREQVKQATDRGGGTCAA